MVRSLGEELSVTPVPFPTYFGLIVAVRLLCLVLHYEMVLGISSPKTYRKGNTMKKTLTIISTLFLSLLLAVGGCIAPANAAPTVRADDWQGVPYRDTSQPAAPGNSLSETDLWAAAAQYQARDGFSAQHALGAGNYTVLNLSVTGEGVAEDLGNGTCPGPIRYTNTATPQTEYVAELGECGGWDRFGWLQEGNVVRLNDKLTGNYMVQDVLALGAPGNTKLSYTSVPDVVLMVNNPDAANEMYVFGLVDYTKRTSNQPLS